MSMFFVPLLSLPLMLTLGSFTSSDVLLFIAAVGVVIVNTITALRTGKVVASLATVEAKADVIVGHVNSRETEYIQKLDALHKENLALVASLSASEKRAELLAAATAKGKP
jgi:hypothetical protein